MFSLMYNFYKYCKKRSERKITLAVLGLDNAGKTTLLNTVKGEVDQETSPTFGFNSSTLQEGKYTLEVFDLGGGKTFRSVWSKYLAEVHGIAYVVDAADASRFEESQKALSDILESNFMKDKPVLVFANKQDLPTAASAAQVVEGLGLATCRNSHNVTPCTAKPPPGTPIDSRLREGLRWLVSAIDRDYSRLDKRVQAEAEEVRQEEARKKKERDERVRKQREERARLQREEEERAREIEKENALHDGKGAVLLAGTANGQPEPLEPVQAASQPAAAGGQQRAGAPMPGHLALGLPNTIESPGKYPPPLPRRHVAPPPTTSDSAASIADQAGAPGTVTKGAPGAAAGATNAAAGTVPGRGGIPPVAPTAMNGASSTRQSRTGAEDGAALAPASSSVGLAARPAGSRPGSAGRGSAGSGGGRSGCSSPRRQATAEGQESGADGSEDVAAAAPAASLRPPRTLPPVTYGGNGGSGGGASDSNTRGSFSIVHQNKVVPLGASMVTDVPA